MSPPLCAEQIIIYFHEQSMFDWECHKSLIFQFYAQIAASVAA